MDEVITLDIGSGGQKTSRLIEERILPLFDNDALRVLGDGAVLTGSERLVFSTDSFVVSPAFFAGGNIGKLAVCGTVNDVCMAGGEPKYLSLSLIIEEGFPVKKLQTILETIRDEAKLADVQIVTGDTKVVERGACDGIYINTAGIGFLRHDNLSPDRIREGDKIIVSGPVGAHGAAVMLARNEGLVEDADIVSDCANVKDAAMKLMTLGESLRCMRDPTRGGIATTLNEWTEGRSFGIILEEAKVPVSPPVDMICEMLGLDPYYLACEGRLLAAVAPEKEKEALELLHASPAGKDAAVIGEVSAEHGGKLLAKTPYGTHRILTKLAGEQLPRIC
ncbi:MAG: hydrogenase expression/formation protein HypE [Lachnospiraceae bacterium]|nr:hydrogenase expression/formation protein HypE [Lachnospiraceae bacterium]